MQTNAKLGSIVVGNGANLQHTLGCEKLYFAVYPPWSDVSFTLDYLYRLNLNRV
jgi:hypothetical protein